MIVHDSAQKQKSFDFVSHIGNPFVCTCTPSVQVSVGISTCYGIPPGNASAVGLMEWKRFICSAAWF